MKINITAEVKPGTQAAAGAAQNLIEQIAIAVATGETTGTRELAHVVGEKREVYATASFSVTAD